MVLYVEWIILSILSCHMVIILINTQKIRENLGSGSRSNLDYFFFIFFFVCVVFMFPKKNLKLVRGVGGFGLTNPSFSRIFYFFLTGEDPLMFMQKVIS